MRRRKNRLFAGIATLGGKCGKQQETEKTGESARAGMHARNRNVKTMCIHALTQNSAMLKIAINAGARVVYYGTEAEAYLQLPAPAMDTRLAQRLEQRFADADYFLKKQWLRASGGR